MAGRVQDFITIRIGSMWIDVPMGPLQGSDSAGSLRTTAASPVVVAHEQEANSKHEEGFTPVLSKSAKRRARRDAAAARRATASKERTVNVRKVMSSRSVPPSFSRPSSYSPPSHPVKPSSRRPTLGEWPIRVTHAAPKKSAPPRKVDFSSTSRAAKTTSSPIPTKTLGEGSLKPALSTPRAGPEETITKVKSSIPREGVVRFDQPHRPQPLVIGKNVVVEETHQQQSKNKGKAVVVEHATSSSESESSVIKSRLRVEAPEFIPSPVYNSGGVEPRCELRWQGVNLSLVNDINKGHVDPSAVLSDPISSETTLPRPSVQSSLSPNKPRRQQHVVREAWDDFSKAVDAMSDTQREFVCDTILAQHKRERRRIQAAANQAIQASIERTICQDLRSLLPGVSASADNVEGEIMRRAEALAKMPEYQTLIKREPWRAKYAKQASNVRAKRDSYKQRELALQADSRSSGMHWVASLSHDGGIQERVTPSTSTMSTRKRASNNRFEAFSSMPVGITEVACSTSDASSTSTHFKRKKPRKQISLGHRPVTRSKTSSGNEKKYSIYVGSYNPLYNEPSHANNELWDTAGSDGRNSPKEDETCIQKCGDEPNCIEQVLMANSGSSAEEQLAQLTEALRQKEEELAALR
ncbi:hypothetical protein PVAP13_5NG333200 [Panicum virgatum]|uniref:Uncharacterized protein n=1 Tax=Panicum virgatum TaxID=38727 RepID=A0A8T0RXY6_PANVG|nr:hypothetical protein PVAP13_5NG333200 [Panicum virgatum]